MKTPPLRSAAAGPASGADQARLQVVGEVIRDGRKALKNKRTGGAPNQSEFHALCRKIENPPPNLRAECLFNRGDEQGRRWLGRVEKGKQAIAPGHARIIEQVCGWPEGVLDAPFTSVDAFEELLKSWADYIAHQQAAPPSQHRVERSAGGGVRVVDLGGISLSSSQLTALPSRTKLAQEIDLALRPNRLQTLRVAVVQGEQGIGKSQLISQWWTSHGKAWFDRTTFTLDCARLGGDQIVSSLTQFFMSKKTTELTPELAARLNELPRLLIVLDGLSHEDGDPLLKPEASEGPEAAATSLRQDRQVTLVPASRADPTAFNRVRELVLFLAESGVRASLLLGVQAADTTSDALALSARLDASAHVETVGVPRLNQSEGARLLAALGAKKTAHADLKALSERLQGLAEAFLTGIAKEGHFKFFGDFFTRYLDALNQGEFDIQAHPHAYLRLLALMPGSVPKSRLDRLMGEGKILRLQNGDTATFERMRIAFAIDQGPYVDINPMVRGLLRQELARHVRKSDPGVARDRAELRWIHITAALDCAKRLPKSASDYTVAEIEVIEGALYHLLAVRDVLDEPTAGAAPDEDLVLLQSLIGKPPSPAAITKYCLDTIVRRYLMDRKTQRATHILGQFETKARLLGLFFDAIDETGEPRHLDLWDQADLYGEIGVCWMHAGRLKLAHQALAKAMRCFQVQGLEVTQDSFPVLGDQRMRQWSETLSTHALVLMRMGRPRYVIDAVLARPVAVSLLYARAVLTLNATLDDERKAKLRSARRLICRDAYVKLRAGDQTGAREGYELALAIEKQSGDKLSGDALRRHIEAMVRRGPCFTDDLAAADALIDRNLQPRRAATARRGSNDIIALYTTKIMLLRALGDFASAGQYLQEAARHPFVTQGECSYVARVELELERFRLLIAQDAQTPESAKELERIIAELEARHHWLLHGDATLVLAEMETGQKRWDLLRVIDRRMNGDDFMLRRGDIETIRDGRSAVKSWGC